MIVLLIVLYFIMGLIVSIIGTYVDYRESWRTDIVDSMRRDNESLEADIQKAENLLLNMGYSQEDLEKLKIKSKLKIVK